MELLSRSTDFFVHVAFWTVVHSLWQGTIFASALAAWRTSAARHDYAARSSAATLTLLFLAAAPIVTATSLALHYIPSAEPSIAGELDLSTLAAVPSAISAVEGDYAETPSASPLSIDAVAACLPPAIALLWSIGVSAGAVKLLASAIRLHVVRRRSTSADDALVNRCRELAQRCGLARAPRLLCSLSARGPYAFGLLRPCIVVPAAWALETSPDVLEAAIAHELAHLKRRDLWTLALQRLVETTLFFHPGVWYVSRALNADRERAADRLAAEVLGDPARYADSLCRLASLVVGPDSPALTLPFHGETRMKLLERVRHVLRTEEAKSGGFSSVGWLCLAPALLAAIFIGQTAFAGSLLAEEAKPTAVEEPVVQDADEQRDDYRALSRIFLGEDSRSLSGDASDWDLLVNDLLTRTSSNADDPNDAQEEGDDARAEDEDEEEEGDRDEQDEEEEGDDGDEAEGPVADLRRQFAEEKARLDEALRKEAQSLEQQYKEQMAAAQERMAAAMQELQAVTQRRTQELEKKFAEAAAQRQAGGRERSAAEPLEGIRGDDADDLTPRERRMLGVIRSLEARLQELESRLPRDGERREEGDRPREERREGDRLREGSREGGQPREERQEGDRPREEAPRAEGERSAIRLQPRSEDEAQQRQFEQLSERLYAALRSDDLLQERKAEFARRAILDVFGQSLNPEQVQIVLERSRGDLAGFRQVLTRISQAREE
jgi:beta-lactamase regulating signal transducer with metallopeptidase domain